MSTSSDGGQTWSTPVCAAGNRQGLGGQPVVQPDGTVIVPFESLKGTIGAFRSTDGGATWSKEFDGLEDPVPPELAAACGRARCRPPRSTPPATSTSRGRTAASSRSARPTTSSSARSPDGVNWSAVSRIPIDRGRQRRRPLHPGPGVDPATSGSGAHLALTYYFYPNAACTPATCELDVGFISSPDGGAHWSADPARRADVARPTSRRPRRAGWSATTSRRRSTPPAPPRPCSRSASAPTNGTAFDEAMWAPVAPITVASGGAAATTTGAHQFTGQGTGETHHALRDD